MQAIPHKIKEWLNERKITDEVIEKFKLGWNGNELVIPVFDENGKIIFNKYRRNPFGPDDGPKYRYEKGSTVSIYGWNMAKEHKTIIYTEGELDCLLLWSYGLPAISSTGGAQSFQREWVDILKDKEIIICMDNDEAGVKGSIITKQFLPESKIIFLPYKQGKDISEYIVNNSFKDFTKLEAEHFNIPQDAIDLWDKKEINKKIKEFKEAWNDIETKKQEDLQNKKSIFPHGIIAEYIGNRYALYNQAKKRIANQKNFKGSGTSIQDAKNVPITNFLDFNRAGYAKCPWHNDKKPSLYYNDFNSKYPNTVKCFACGAMCDVIDVIMELKNMNLKEAVNFLTKNE